MKELNKVTGLQSATNIPQLVTNTPQLVRWPSLLKILLLLQKFATQGMHDMASLFKLFGETKCDSRDACEIAILPTVIIYRYLQYVFLLQIFKMH